VVRDVDDRTLLVLALVENIQREALNPLEEAEGFQLLAGEFGLTQGEIAEAVGRDRSTVANTLRLLRLPPSVRRYLLDGSLSMGHASALLAVDDPARLAELARHAAEEGWTVRAVEGKVRSEPAGGKGRSRKKSRAAGSADPAIHALQEALQEALGTRVRLRSGRKGTGAIEIPFGSSSDLERLFELITGRDSADVIG
jgi:ParB family chromosome partitioning protein